MGNNTISNGGNNARPNVEIMRTPAKRKTAPKTAKHYDTRSTGINYARAFKRSQSPIGYTPRLNSGYSNADKWLTGITAGLATVGSLAQLGNMGGMGSMQNLMGRGTQPAVTAQAGQGTTAGKGTTTGNETTVGSGPAVDNGKTIWDGNRSKTVEGNKTIIRQYSDDKHEHLTKETITEGNTTIFKNYDDNGNLQKETTTTKNDDGTTTIEIKDMVAKTTATEVRNSAGKPTSREYKDPNGNTTCKVGFEYAEDGSYTKTKNYFVNGEVDPSKTVVQQFDASDNEIVNPGNADPAGNASTPSTTSTATATKLDDAKKHAADLAQKYATAPQDGEWKGSKCTITEGNKTTVLCYDNDHKKLTRITEKEGDQETTYAYFGQGGKPSDQYIVTKQSDGTSIGEYANLLDGSTSTSEKDENDRITHGVYRDSNGNIINEEFHEYADGIHTIKTIPYKDGQPLRDQAVTEHYNEKIAQKITSSQEQGVNPGNTKAPAEETKLPVLEPGYMALNQIQSGAEYSVGGHDVKKDGNAFFVDGNQVDANVFKQLILTGNLQIVD